MTEHEFEVTLREFLNDRETSRSTWQGIVTELPDQVAVQLSDLDVWTWRNASSLIKPDVLIGDQTDVLRMVIEVKAPTAAVQWSRRASLRSATADGVAANRVAAEYLDSNDPSCDPRWDAPHEDDLGCGCAHWKWQPGHVGDLHYPAVHQADCYAYTWDYVVTADRTSHEDSLTVDPADAPTFVFLDPGGKREEFLADLVTSDIWHIVSLPAVVENWRKDRSLANLVDAAESMLRQ